MNQRTLTHGVITGAMCPICALICQRLLTPSVWGIHARNSYGGLQAHKAIVHGIKPPP